MRTVLIAAVASSALLSACGLAKVDKEADAKARALYEQVRTGADLSANADLAPDLKTPPALAQLAGVRLSLPEGAPTTTATRSWNISINNGATTAAVVHAYSYPASTVLAETILAKGADKTWKITGFHVKIEDPSGPKAPVAPPPVTVEKTQDT